MRKKHSLIIVLTVIFVLSGFASFSFGEANLPKKKQTSLGLYVNAKDAFIKWLHDQDNIKIIDCRTPEEYFFVGHAKMAYNIPFKFMTYQFDMKKNKTIFKKNPDFVELVKEKFRTTDTIMIMCRSGARSAASVNALAKAGFKNVYTITDGFEGDKVKDPESAYHGKRLKNGWKNAGNAWGYKLDPKLMYITEKK